MRKTKLGQHFLKNTAIARREIAYAELTDKDVVLEIGPGKGVLTQLLAQKAKQVIAVELDENLYRLLKTTISSNVLLIHADVLHLNLAELPKFNKVVSNLPFQISSPFIFKLLESHFEKAVLIVQKDFAERMVACAGSKHYSRLSVTLYYKSTCRILELVSKNNFSPVPKVDACIVEIIPRSKPPFYVDDEQFFYTILQQLFAHRRKKIRNCLQGLLPVSDEIPFLDNRVEQLTPDKIAELVNRLNRVQ